MLSCGCLDQRRIKAAPLCARCYQLFVKRRICINGQWYMAQPAAPLDFFVLTAVGWYTGQEISDPDPYESKYYGK